MTGTSVQLNIQLHGAILHVDNLARSIDFYTRLLDFAVVRQSSDAAALANPAGATTMALRERPAQHFTDRTVQALVWDIPTLGELDEVEQRLQRLNARALKRGTYEETFTLLSAKDPDGQRLLFIHHDGAADVPSELPSEVFWY